MPPFVRIWFDRGSLCLEGALGPGLGFAMWDDAARCFRAPALRYADVLGAAARLGLAVDDQIAPGMRLPLDGRGGPAAGGDGREADWHLPPPRPFARDALHAFDAFGGRAVVAAPPGPERAAVALGAMASSAAASLLLCPCREDVARWERAVRRWYDGPVATGTTLRADVSLLTFDEAYQAMDAAGARYGLVVVDGASRFAAGLRPEALEMCAAPERLGLCDARPVPGSAGERRLRDLLGPTACELIEAPLPQARQAGQAGQAAQEHQVSRAFRATRVMVPLDGMERQELDRSLRPLQQARALFERTHPGAGLEMLLSALPASPEGRAARAGYLRAVSLSCLPSGKRAVARELLARHRGDRVLLVTGLATGAFSLSAENIVALLASDLPRSARPALSEALAQGNIVVSPSLEALARAGAPPGTAVAILLGGASPGTDALSLVAGSLRPPPGRRAIVYELVSFESVEDGAWLRGLPDGPGAMPTMTRKSANEATPAHLEEAALRYLGRYAASSGDLRRILLREVRRSAATHGTDPQAGAAAVEAILERFQGSRLLDDRAFAEARARKLRERGGSTLAVRARLDAHGLPDEQIDAALHAAGSDGQLAELDAAWAFARRRRLGPFRPEDERKQRRIRDLGAMGRAGFGHSVASSVIDATAPRERP
jgi:regulatory protein